MDLLQTYQLITGVQKQREAKQQEQDQRVAQGILGKLAEYKDDPAKYNAFKSTFIDNNPQVRASLERVYTPQGLSGMLDSSQMETPEQRIQKKAREASQYNQQVTMADLEQKSSPEYISLISKQAAQRQKIEDQLNLDPQHLASQNQLISLKKAQEINLQNDLEKLPAAQAIRKRAEIERAAPYTATYKDSYSQIMPELLKNIDDPEKQQQVIKEMAVRDDNSGLGVSRKQRENLISHLTSTYDQARLMPEGWKSPEDLDEQEIKEGEREAMMSIITGTRVKNGKIVPVNEKERNILINMLASSPLNGMRPSPYFALVGHLVHKKNASEYTSNELSANELILKALEEQPKDIFGNTQPQSKKAVEALNFLRSQRKMAQK